MLKKKLFAIILPLTYILIMGGCGLDGIGFRYEPPPETSWTVMYYGDADNNLEPYLLDDVREMKDGFVDGQGINLILLFDRIPSYSSDRGTFGENFTDTRLYRVTSGSTWRLDGGNEFPEITTSSNYEANMGDPETLKKFIQFCKVNYPADKYALIFSNHGSGPRKKSLGGSSEYSTTKALCSDDTDDDILYTAEISTTLTADESVALLGLDACLMSSVEFAYQFRNGNSNKGFKADIMVASAPNVYGYGWDYEAIFQRLQNKGGTNGTTDTTLGGYERYYDPAVMSAKEFSAIIVEEQRDSTWRDGSQSLTSLDLSKVSSVKKAVDQLAIALDGVTGSMSKLENLRGNAPAAKLLHYFQKGSDKEWIAYPFFDLYNLADAIANSSDFSSIKTEAQAVTTAVKSTETVDGFVIYSFANSDFTGFEPNASGVHIFFPDGDYTASGYDSPCWAYQWWYNPQRWTQAGPTTVTVDGSGEFVGGLLDWCIYSSNGTAKCSSNNTVENWFELLDKWYDNDNNNNRNSWEY